MDCSLSFELTLLMVMLVPDELPFSPKSLTCPETHPHTDTLIHTTRYQTKKNTQKMSRTKYVNMLGVLIKLSHAGTLWKVFLGLTQYLNSYSYPWVPDFVFGSVFFFFFLYYDFLTFLTFWCPLSFIQQNSAYYKSILYQYCVHCKWRYERQNSMLHIV